MAPMLPTNLKFLSILPVLCGTQAHIRWVFVALILKLVQCTLLPVMRRKLGFKTLFYSTLKDFTREKGNVYIQTMDITRKLQDKAK